MRFRRGARLDPSQVQDARGARLGPVGGVVGGGGLAGVILTIVLLLVNGGGGGGNGLALGVNESSNDELASECTTGADANQREDCLIVGVVNSVQSYWQDTVRGYTDAPTRLYTGQVNTGCGFATSAVGPFYCPADQTVYIDLGFFDELESRFGARGGPFAEAYVVAHEYGHHVQHLVGNDERVGNDREGPESGSVRLELQADCFAGAWGKNAVDTGFIEQITPDDIAAGLDAAGAVGDDRIQQRAQGRVSPESFTHGTSEQRRRWFKRGYDSGDPAQCDTFSASAL
jgi:predicted metalloprotease